MAVSSGWYFDYPMSACGDLQSYIYHFVMQAGTAKRVILATGASNPAPLGVLQGTPRNLEEAPVRILGSTQVYANADSGAIAYGDFLTCASDGQAIVNTNGSSVNAVAMQALASGSGVLIEALLLPFASGNKTDNVP